MALRERPEDGGPPAEVVEGHGGETRSGVQPVVEVATTFLLRLARARSGDLAVVRAMTRADRVADPYDVLRVL